MATTKIRGNTQIIDNTITNAQINSAAAIATSKLADGANFIKKDGSVAFTADQSAGGFKITNIATPVSSTDAANKAYVDAVTQARSWKDAVRVTTTANITLSGTQTIDGIALSVGDRVLVKNQSTAADNGIYLVASGTWTRSTDADVSAEVLSGLTVNINEGSTYGDTRWVLTTDGTITLGSTSLTFQQDSVGGTYLGGAGMVLSGSTFNVQATNASILVGADDLAVQLKSDGGLETHVTGGLKVLLDGSSLALSSSGLKLASGTIVTRETPSGTINGSNTAFVLAGAPAVVGSEHVYLNGILQDEGGSNDYTISGATITFNTAPISGDKIRVSYRAL